MRRAIARTATKTAHVGRQYLGNRGKIENGVVSVGSVWADEGVYSPLAVEPYTPERWFAAGKADPAFRTEPQWRWSWSIRPGPRSGRSGRWWPMSVRGAPASPRRGPARGS